MEKHSERNQATGNDVEPPPVMATNREVFCPTDRP